MSVLRGNENGAQIAIVTHAQSLPERVRDQFLRTASEYGQAIVEFGAHVQRIQESRHLSEEGKRFEIDAKRAEAAQKLAIAKTKYLSGIDGHLQQVAAGANSRKPAARSEIADLKSFLEAKEIADELRADDPEVVAQRFMEIAHGATDDLAARILDHPVLVERISRHTGHVQFSSSTFPENMRVLDAARARVSEANWTSAERAMRDDLNALRSAHVAVYEIAAKEVGGSETSSAAA